MIRKRSFLSQNEDMTLLVLFALEGCTGIYQLTFFIVAIGLHLEIGYTLLVDIKKWPKLGIFEISVRFSKNSHNPITLIIHVYLYSLSIESSFKDLKDETTVY